MQDYKVFYEAIADPASINFKGRKVIGYLCSYAPEELIYAAGLHPMRLFSSKSDISLADNHLQAYCCSLVRGVLEDSLAGRLGFLDGTVFPHTCDSIQRLSDIWRLNTRYEFFADVIMPVKLNTESARSYMRATLERFKSDLEEATGREITDDDLQESIDKFNRIRASLGRLYELRRENPALISGADMYAVVKGSMMMNRDELLELLPPIVAKLEAADVPSNGAKRLVISGSICDSPDIYNIIEEAGGVVVGDDLCTGQRWFAGQMAGDPMEALTSRYVERIVCPAKHSSITARGENIVSLVEQSGADGAIFMLLKFCDPHAFDYPYMKRYLDEAGIQNMLIEMDDQLLSGGQLATRLETFIHMI